MEKNNSLNEPSEILNLENKVLTYLENCKSIYVKYKKNYLIYFKLIESAIKVVERIKDNVKYDKAIIEKLLKRCSILKSFMNAMEIKFDKNYNDFLSLDKNFISKNDIKKMNFIYQEMNSIRETFNNDINKIIYFDKDNLDE